MYRLVPLLVITLVCAFGCELPESDSDPHQARLASSHERDPGQGGDGDTDTDQDPGRRPPDRGVQPPAHGRGGPPAHGRDGRPPALGRDGGLGLDRDRAVAVDDPFAYEKGNGNKVVIDSGNKLHNVFSGSGSIFYTTSTNAVTWTTPVAVDMGAADCDEPTLAIDLNDDMGLLATCGGTSPELYYTYSTDGGASWAPGSFIDEGQEPSIVDLNAEMHMTWAGKFNEAIFYHRFPTTAPVAAPGSTPNPLVDADCLCGPDFRFNKPSIAVDPISDTLNNAIVIAYGRRIRQPFGSSGPFNPAESSTSLVVNLATPPAPGAPLWDMVAASSRFQPFYIAPGSPTLVQVHSVSLTVNEDEEFFAMWSTSFEGEGGSDHQTQVMRWDWDGSVYGPETINTLKSFVDVVAQDEAETGDVRVAWTEIGPFTYGAMRYRTGEWGGASTSLGWTSAIKTHANGTTFRGRDPQAIFWTGTFSILGSPPCSLRAMYERWTIPSDAYVIASATNGICAILEKKPPPFETF